MRRATAALTAALIFAAGCGGGAEPVPGVPAPAPADTEAPPPATTTAEPVSDDCADRSYWTSRGYSRAVAEIATAHAGYFLQWTDIDPCQYTDPAALEAAKDKHRAPYGDAPDTAAAAEAATPPPEPPPSTGAVVGAPPPSTAPDAEDTGPDEVYAEEGELGVVAVPLEEDQPDEIPETPPEPEQPEARDCLDGEDDNECERLGRQVRDCLNEGKTAAECGIVDADNTPIIDYGSNEHGEEAHGHPPPLAALPPASGTVHGVLEDLADPDADGPWGDARMTVPLAIEVGDEFLGDVYEGERLRGRVTRPPRQYGDGPGRWTVYMCVVSQQSEELGYDAFREDDGSFRLNTQSGFPVPDNPCPPEAP